MSIYQKSGLALAGYDPVAYFEEGKALQGSKQFQTKWKELDWRFTSDKHRELFTENPEKFLPQYGGYCAFGVSNGYLAKPKLSTFTLIGDHLYLNFSEYVKERWQENREVRIHDANKKWDQTKTKRPIVANRFLIYLKYRFFKLLGKDTLA